MFRDATLQVDVVIKRLMIRIVDLACVAAAFWTAYFIRTNLGYELGLDRQPSAGLNLDLLGPHNMAHFMAILVTSWSLTAFSLYHFESHERMRVLTHLDECYVVFKSLTVAFVLMLAITGFYAQYSFSRASLVLFYLMSLAAVCAWRVFLKSFLHEVRRRGYNWVKILIVGAGDVGRLVRRNLLAQEEFGYRVVGFVDDALAPGSELVGGLPVLGGCQDIPELVGSLGIDEVILAMPSASREEVAGVFRIAEASHVSVSMVPALFDITTPTVTVSHLGHIPLVKTSGVRATSWESVVKRVFDITLSGVALVVAVPLMALIAVAIRLETPGPIFFHQVRVGRHGRRFTIVKFRSMDTDAERRLGSLRHLNEVAGGVTFKIRRDPRVTVVGRILRRYSLDELPQLTNVLMGDMSLVGPRPPLVGEVEAYSEMARRRLETTPGLTGLWQVSGRNETSFDRMVELDLEYIDNWSLWEDVKIILRSIPVVLRGRGAY